MGRHWTLFAAVVISSLCAPLASADGEEVSFGAGLDLNSKYVWRGILLTGDAVAQPSVEASYMGFTLNIWANHDLVNDNDADFEPSEVDYTLSYGTSMAGVDIGAGVIHYTFPNTPFEATTEVYVEAGLPDIILSPTITVYSDVDEIEGLYAALSLGHEFEIRDDITLGLGVTLGYGSSDHNEGYYGLDDSALADVLVTASLTVPLSDSLTVSTSLGFAAIVDDDIRDLSADPDNAIIGVSIGYSF